jgi:hypothetical protein
MPGDGGAAGAAGAAGGGGGESSDSEAEAFEEEELANRISRSVVVDGKFLGPGKGEGRIARKGGSAAWDDTRLQKRVDGWEDVF